MSDTKTVTLSGQPVSLQRFSFAKAMRVITLLGLLQKTVPDIVKAAGEFRREYRETNVIELDRVQAKLRYGPQPIVGDDGEPLTRPDGELLTIPSPIDRLSEQDWERSGHVLKVGQDPSTQELLFAMFPLIYERAEEVVQRLLALIAMPNDDVARYATSGELEERLDEYARDTIAKAYLDEVMEFAVAAAELVEGQVMTKAKQLGDRVGNLKRLFGIQTTSSSPETSPTQSEPLEQPSTASSGPSPESSPGETPSESSDSPGTPSATSATSSSESES